MNALSIIGLILAVIVLGVTAYRGFGALTATLMASLVVILTNGMGIWQGLSEFYMNGYIGAYSSFFLMFCCSSLYAGFMNESGSAASIGYQLIDWFGKKNVLLVCFVLTALLTYGGVSLFVVIYATAPIMFLLFKEADLPRHLTVAIVAAGSASFTMTALPGTPSLTNVIPTQFLGTTLTAAPVFGILATIAMFVMSMLYMNRCEKKARENGEHWESPEGMDPALLEIKDRSTLPSSAKAFAPMVVLMVIILIGSRFGINSTMLATGAMLAGTIVTFILNFDKFKGKSLKKLISSGLEGGIDSIGGYAGVVAFGAVVTNSAAFSMIVEWVSSLHMNPYVQGVVSTMAISAITGSSSGGLKIMLSAFADEFIASGVNLQLLHRLICISADALDTLPHSPGMFLMFAVLGLTHKQAYKHVFWTSTVIPLIVTFVSLVILVIFF